MVIKRSPELEEKIIDIVKENWITKIRTDVALTDLIYPRKAYFQRVDPKDPTLTEILDFLRGKSIETGLGNLLGMDHPKSKIAYGIWYNPDFRFPEITELKSRRGFLAKEGEEEERYGYYIKQHKGYCALEGESSGNLIIFALAEKADDGWKTEPKLVAYRCEYTDEDLREHLEWLIERRDLFLSTIKDGDFTRLPECEDFNCGVTHRKLEEKANCTCGKSWVTDKWAFMHKKTFKEKEHKISLCKYSYSFEPRCKWIETCNPSIYKKIME
jgi:hypothetical protein